MLPLLVGRLLHSSVVENSRAIYHNIESAQELDGPCNYFATLGTVRYIALDELNATSRRAALITHYLGGTMLIAASNYDMGARIGEGERAGFAYA
jgi:hypothetical protein